MAKDFSHPKIVEAYDAHIRNLIPAYELVHLSIQSILTTHLHHEAKILIAGCGTGYELQYLAEQFPNARFVAIDPSTEMIKKAKSRIQNSVSSSRVEFVHGDTSVLEHYPDYFDAALSILVSHFIAEPDKTEFFKQIQQSLVKNGILLTYDLMRMDAKTQQILFQLTQFNGLTEKQSLNMVERLEEDFALVDSRQMHDLLEKSGFLNMQIFMQIIGFYGFFAFK